MQLLAGIWRLVRSHTLLAFGFSTILLTQLGQPGIVAQGEASSSYRDNQSAGAPQRSSLKLEGLRGELRAPFNPDAGVVADATSSHRSDCGLAPFGATSCSLQALPWSPALGRAPPFPLS